MVIARTVITTFVALVAADDDSSLLQHQNKLEQRSYNEGDASKLEKAVAGKELGQCISALDSIAKKDSTVATAMKSFTDNGLKVNKEMRVASLCGTEIAAGHTKHEDLPDALNDVAKHCYSDKEYRARYFSTDTLLKSCASIAPKACKYTKGQAKKLVGKADGAIKKALKQVSKFEKQFKALGMSELLTPVMNMLKGSDDLLVAALGNMDCVQFENLDPTGLQASTFATLESLITPFLGFSVPSYTIPSLPATGGTGSGETGSGGTGSGGSTAITDAVNDALSGGTPGGSTTDVNDAVNDANNAVNDAINNGGLPAGTGGLPTGGLPTGGLPTGGLPMGLR